jgi:regulator of protease activity HflC (stomatin/prohibitin superfamily)
MQIDYKRSNRNVSYYQNKSIQLEISSAASSSRVHPWPVLLFLLTLAITIAVGFYLLVKENFVWAGVIAVAGFILAFIFMICLKVVDQWDRVVVLRFGKFIGVRTPGVFFLIPFVDTVGAWIDTRVHATDLVAEEALTRDTVPVDVDAVMFWFVFDSKMAALEVEDYAEAVSWAAQTALRDLIGKTELADLLTGRETIDSALQELIDSRTTPWGITVNSVEIRDIKIPQGLQDAMSRQAQAERERQARIILGDSELQIADKFAKASESYAKNPTAMHLRAMNMLFEGLKERGALMVVPSSALDTMNLGGLMGMASMGGMSVKPGEEAGQPHNFPPGNQ